MANYDFTSLSSYDFEWLVRDLLQSEMRVTLESFKTGRDRGIDLRYSRDPAGTLIAQCKHYAVSGYDKLRRHLEIEELPKVIRLNPARYIIATSVGLTPNTKDALWRLFHPYCQGPHDVYGRDDLNNLLGIFEGVERNNLKLWLTSYTVLDRVLHSAVYNQSDLELEQLKKRVKFYVQNESFAEALKILNEHHYCVIAGIPGIGKTTLAEVLLAEHMRRGYEVFVVSGDVREALDVFSPIKAQLFYYDDFLGQNMSTHMLAKNEDRNLVRLIRGAQNSKSTRLILTTREYILKHAKSHYELLDRSGLDVAKCVLKLESYTKYERSKILYNHVYFSNLPQSHKDALVANRSYIKIVNHKNYNPRIVEWMTDYTTNHGVSADRYVETFLENLDNPATLWGHAFSNQLSDAARALLIALASLPPEVFISDLEEAFAAYYGRHAAIYNLPISPQEFRKALERLEGTFISINHHREDVVVRFQNPSIRDYLESYLAENDQEVMELIRSAAFFEQCVRLGGNHGAADSRSSGRASLSLRPVVLRHKKEFISILLRTFASLSANLSTAVSSGRPEFYKVRARRSLEARMLFALDVLGPEAGNRVHESLDFMLRLMLEDLPHHVGEKRALISLVRRIHSEGLIFNIPLERILNQVKQYLMLDLDVIDDFDSIKELGYAFSGLITDEDEIMIKTAFMGFYPEDVEWCLGNEEDYEALRSHAESLGEMAAGYELEIDEELEKLLRRADELEYRATNWDDNEDAVQYSNVQAASGDAEIDNLFDSLRGAPGEPAG